MFYFDTINGKRILRSDLLQKEKYGVSAFFTTREWNIDDFKKFSCRIVNPVQTHSDNVDIIDSRNEYPDTDGLIIKESCTMVYLKFADCTPLIFYDPINNIGAVSHAGWRGTAQKIGVKTVEKMSANFKTKAENVIVLIGPAIGMCCYEVSDDVKEKCISTVKNKNGLYKGRNIDLKQINARQLNEIGVKNIDIAPFCTSCDNNLFYSYRRENETKNRHFAVLSI